MAKVWVVVECCEIPSVLGAFSTKERAEDAIASRSDRSIECCDPVEVEIDSTGLLVHPGHVVGKVFRVFIRVGDSYIPPAQDGDFQVYSRHPSECSARGPFLIPGRGPYNWFEVVSPISRAHAEKTAIEATESRRWK